MRVIRTEMYFNPSEVNAFDGHSRYRELGDKNPGVGFAWFRADTPIDGAQISALKGFRPFRLGSRRQPQRSDIEGILDLFVRDADEISFSRIPNEAAIENRDIVNYILDQEIVMEHSPPFSFSLKVLLNKANTPLWIGTFIGSAAAWDHPALLLLTVPGGIIVVSSAAGIGRAMDSGLNKLMERLFKGDQ